MLFCFQSAFKPDNYFRTVGRDVPWQAALLHTLVSHNALVGKAIATTNAGAETAAQAEQIKHTSQQVPDDIRPGGLREALTINIGT